jgi:hypothetical protein
MGENEKRPESKGKHSLGSQPFLRKRTELKLGTVDDKFLPDVNSVIRQPIPCFEVLDRHPVFFGNTVKGLPLGYRM